MEKQKKEPGDRIHPLTGYMRIVGISFAVYTALLILGVIAFHGYSYYNTLHKADRMGWKWKDDSKVITVDVPEFQRGMDYWADYDYPHAETELAKALELAAGSNGKSNVQTAAISQKLGALYLEIGKYEKAYDCLIEAYITFRDELGEEDGNTILSTGQLAVCDLRQGNYEQALTSLNELFDRKMYWRHKLQVCQLLAECNVYLGNYKKALEWYDILPFPYTKLGLPDDLNLVNLLNDYGIMQIDVGNYETAVQSFEEALKRWEGLNIHVDSTVQSVYSNLSTAYAYVNNDEEAVRCAEKALEIQEELYGPGSIHVAQAYDAVSRAYDIQERRSEQLTSLEKALDIALASAGENHAVTAAVYYDLGAYYQAVGDTDSAISSYEHALEIRKNILGQDSVITAFLYDSLAEACRIAGKTDEAMENAEYAMKVFEDIFGREHVSSAYADLVAAWTYADAGMKEESYKAAQQGFDILERHKKYCAENRPYSYQTMGYVFYKGGDHEEAVRYLEKAKILYGESGSCDVGKHIMNTDIFLGDAYRDSGDIESGIKAYILAYKAADELYEGEIPATIGNRLKSIFERETASESYEEWLGALLERYSGVDEKDIKEYL